MTRTFRLPEYTTLEDVAAWTSAESSEKVVLRITGSSGFAPTVEGVALGVLQQLIQRGSVVVDCSIHPEKAPKLFESLFGVSLSLGAQAIASPEGKDRRAETAERLWQAVLKARGYIGTGNHVSLVFRDPDYRVPHSLRGADGEFPKRDFFRTALSQAVRAMGFNGSFSASEEDVITFLYEATQNSHDHARVRTDGRAVVGARGILLERISVKSSEELESRRDLAGFQRSYIRRVAASLPWPAMFFAFTVADVGAGIHHTLPVEPEESSFDRLNRAFVAGVTRKQRGVGLEPGQGLAKVHDSALRLRALLFVRSAELSGHIDFSSGVDTRRLSVGCRRFGPIGTSLTMMWPATETGGDQPSLFE